MPLTVVAAHPKKQNNERAVNAAITVKKSTAFFLFPLYTFDAYRLIKTAVSTVSASSTIPFTRISGFSVISGVIRGIIGRIIKCFIYSPLFKKIGGGVPPMTPLRPFGLACVIEQALNLGRYGRHNGGVKEYIQTAEQERADNNGDENFYAGVNIALRLLAGDSGANGGNCGVYLVSDLLEHKFLPHSFFDLFCGFSLPWLIQPFQRASVRKPQTRRLQSSYELRT